MSDWSSDLCSSVLVSLSKKPLDSVNIATTNLKLTCLSLTHADMAHPIIIFADRVIVSPVCPPAFRPFQRRKTNRLRCHDETHGLQRPHAIHGLVQAQTGIPFRSEEHTSALQSIMRIT